MWSAYGGFTLDAMGVQLYAFILPTLLGLWGLSGSRASTLAAAALLAGAVGGWAAGSLSDRIGRVRILRVTIAWLAVSTAFCGLANSYNEFLIARIIQGVGFGAEWAVGAVFLGEVAAPAARGRTIGAVQSAWATGWLFAAATTSLALWLLPANLGWRAVFFIGLLPAIWIFCLRMRLHEAVDHGRSARVASWHGIFARPMIGRTVRGTLLATGTHGGYWALATWWPAMLRIERKMSLGQSTVYFAALVGGSFVGYYLSGWVSDRYGRRVTLATFASGGVATVLATTLLPLSPVAFLILSACLGLFALGIYSSVGAVLIELFPRQLSGSGLGFCYNLGRGLAGVGPLAVGSSIGSMGIAHSIGLYVTVAYALVLLATVLLPETRGSELGTMAAPG
ncbi:MFS transporter [Sphingobium sp. PNB]|uniref:MFS transporter n=1 Tax=Sphingobium sp. PNB TaxID=863934 RepID=UPI001CA3F2DE|nr:MFS transporter [Sphingobium sp. PNB]MCB4858435.1 MFS transporter [Sphingobium sp. PNB]